MDRRTTVTSFHGPQPKVNNDGHKIPCGNFRACESLGTRACNGNNSSRKWVIQEPSLIDPALNYPLQFSTPTHNLHFTSATVPKETQNQATERKKELTPHNPWHIHAHSYKPHNFPARSYIPEYPARHMHPSWRLGCRIRKRMGCRCMLVLFRGSSRRVSGWVVEREEATYGHCSGCIDDDQMKDG
jgi:hypothetical protein